MQARTLRQRPLLLLLSTLAILVAMAVGQAPTGKQGPADPAAPAAIEVHDHDVPDHSRESTSEVHVEEGTNMFEGFNPFTIPAAEAAAARPAVWFGSPGHFSWPRNSSSHPANHHTFRWGDPYRGDWGADFQSASHGETVRVYAAPQDTRYNSRTTARVINVAPACARRSGESHADQLRRGGWAVVVQIRIDSTTIGTLKYVHIEPSVRNGQTISRWGGLVGRIGTYRSNSCWTGRHVHFEAMNYSKYSCYNRGWRPGQAMRPSNFTGFLGGHYASAPRRPCP